MISERVYGFAEKLKHNQTPSEIIFKRILLKILNKEYSYLNVSTQTIFKHKKGYYIVDFFIGQINLGFEIDGGYHWKSEQIDKDLKRDHFFESEKDIILIHIPNSQVENIEKHEKLSVYLKNTVDRRIGEMRKINPKKYLKLKRKYIISLKSEYSVMLGRFRSPKV